MNLNLTAILKDHVRTSISAGLTWIDMAADIESNQVSLTMYEL